MCSRAARGVGWSEDKEEKVVVVAVVVEDVGEEGRRGSG